MKEVISIHVGQAGIQTGNSCWELFCLEHGIQEDGQIMEKNFDKENEFVTTFFSDSQEGKFAARSIYIDLDPQIIDEIRIRKNVKIIKPEYLISGNQDSSNNFAIGYHSLGREIVDVCVDRIRKLAEECQNLQGFLFYHSVAGGTGSGLGKLLLEKLMKDYEKQQKISFSIYPSKHLSTSLVEPYNSILTTNALRADCDATIVFDNEAVYDICSKKLDIEYPQFKNLNCLIAQVISQLTASMRFEGAFNNNFTEFIENTVKLPMPKFLTTSYSPFLSMSKPLYENPSVSDITNELFLANNMLIKANPEIGKYVTCNIFYRGDVIPKYVSSALAEIKTKKTINFVDWCYRSFKVGINYQSPISLHGSEIVNIEKAVCMVANQTFISQFFKRHSQSFNFMFEKRAFVHWYLSEGMEEGEFQNAREGISNLLQDYGEMDKSEEIIQNQ